MYANRARTLPGLRGAALAVLALAAALALAVLSVHNAPSVHGQDPPAPSVSFSAATIANKTYTVGARVDDEASELPTATLSNPPANSIGTHVTYAATGLPAGLVMGADRVIRGTPTTATVSAATVTYTATVTNHVDPSGGPPRNDVTKTDYTGTLTFTVTINGPVTFGDQASLSIHAGLIAWEKGEDGEADAWVGNLVGADGEVTFPAAQGGTGTLTYSLIDNNSKQPLASVRESADMNSALTGITFNAATRKLGGTPAEWAQKPWGVSYWAEDEKGSRAELVTMVYANGRPGGL